MHGERQRHSRPDRLPRRPVDRIEDLVIWVLISLALLTVVLAATVAMRRYGEVMHRVDIETRERVQVSAVLLEPTPQLLVTDDRTRVVREVPSRAPVSYIAPDGTERRAETLVAGRRPAGATVPLWVDRSGQTTDAPARGADALRGAASVAVGVLVVGAAVLGGVWAGVRWGVDRVVMVRWEREWERVEPQWSGRST
jgi:hypothetical protein